MNHAFPTHSLQSSQQSDLRQLSSIQPPRSTRSSSTAPSFCHLITRTCQSLNIHRPTAVPLFGTNSRKYCDKYLTHPTNSPKLHILLSLHSSFTPNGKHCPLLNPTMISVGSRGGKSGYGPPIEIGNGVWPPFGTERAMEVL